MRTALLAASSKQSGITAGLDNERILIPSLADRERLLVVHHLVADLLVERPFELVARLARTDHFSLQLVVLRGTVLALALLRENALEGEISRSGLEVDEPAPALLAVLGLDSELFSSVVNGYRAYLANIWRNVALQSVPAIDVVVRLLAGLSETETRGAALAAATVYRAQLSVGLDDEALYHEQLALMTAFIGADSVSFQNGRLHIP